MNSALLPLLAELEAFAVRNDHAVTDRSQRMVNITRDTGEFLAVLVHATGARQILEIGTSNGYSTLWLAQATQRLGGHITTVEVLDFKVGMARHNFQRAGLEAVITQVHGDAGTLLATAVTASIDLLFLDCKRSQYVTWWPDIKRVVRPGGLLVVDNATSHADEIAPLVSRVAADADFATCTVHVGNGEFLATRIAPER